MVLDTASRCLQTLFRFSSQRFFPILLLPLVFYNSPAQTTVTFGPTRDNTLYESTTGALSNGAGEYMFVGKTKQTAPSTALRRVLIAFDISANVPAGAAITSVTLTLNMSKTSSGAQNVELHRVLSNWGEGTSNAGSNEGSGAAATTGDATWLHTFFNASQWTNPGGDYTPGASATQSVAGSGSYSWGSTAQMVGDVQSWLASPAANFGWVLIGNESASATSKRFDSRENATSANRPKLSVTYTTTSGVGGNHPMPSEFALAQNFPNPFNPTTVISYQSPVNGIVTLRVFDILGREVATLVNEERAAGSYAVRWDASSCPSGIYIYRLQLFGEDAYQRSYSAQRSMILIK